MINRRQFLKQGISFGGLLLSSPYIYGALESGDVKKLTILHTNDTHSRIDAFPANDPKFPNQGGIYRRASYIDRVRAQEKNVILLDAGDVFQGTPYFNMYGGEIELKAMSALRYDVATMGNHDFDNGIDGFHKMLPHAKFPFVSANYDFSNTILHKSIKPYHIIKIDGLKIGVFGLGVELKGLVLKKLYQETQYIDPIETAKTWSSFLKHEQHCDLVICLSHLGYEYKENKVSDVVLAKACRDVDIIIGGHTHTFLDKPTEINNNGKKVLVNQCGWGGLYIGQIDVIFSSKARNEQTSAVYWGFNKKNMLI